MSEENLQKLEGQEPIAPEEQGAESFDVTLNRTTNELKIKDPTTGRIITFKAQIEGTKEAAVEEVEDEGVVHGPLAPDMFREVLQKIDTLGLTWTADLQPSIRAKKPENEEALLSDAFLEIRHTYPNLPREVGSAFFHALTGSKPLTAIVGSDDQLQKKVTTVREFIITPEFRSEFFFKHAIKVPYLTDIDWEVVFKVGEKNVKGSPGIPYALLSLLFHNPNMPGGQPRSPGTITVAVNDFLVSKLMGILTEVKAALEASQQVASLWRERSKLTNEDDNAKTTGDPKRLA